MSTLSDTELKARMRAIASGPWARRGRLAFSRLAPPKNAALRQLIHESPLDDNVWVPYKAAQSQIHSLEQTLRWHLLESPTLGDQKIRNSFDEALTYFQLLELAVETGYLPQEQLDDSVRSSLTTLCWSPPARQFIRDYEYVSVESLAGRLNVGGFSRRPSVPIDPTGAVHFAAFLATHRAVESDDSISTWLAFLDDYVASADEQNDFRESLKSGRPATTRRRQTLIAGAYRFVSMLADFLDPIPEGLKSRFATFYQYWIARMYGYVRGKYGFERNVTAWAEGESWVAALQQWFDTRAALTVRAEVLNGREVDSKTEEELARKVFSDAILVLDAVWKEIRSPMPRSSFVDQQPFVPQ